jgi:hypothetical protein
MRIENLRKETNSDRTRVVATVIWENRDRPAQDVFFETTAEFAADLTCNPNAFLAACTLPAMRFGEERIALTEPICPALKDGLETVMHTLVTWHGGDRRVIAIEAPLQQRAPQVGRPPRAGCFFSGGIDALAMLRQNHQKFPQTHPHYFQDGILIYGILKGEDEQDPAFHHVMDAVSALAKDAGITLIPMYTNAHSHLRDLDPMYKFWKQDYQGSLLAAVGHALSHRLSSVSIASSFDFANLEPYSTHPQIDPHLSSSDLQVRHEDITLSRFSKTRIVGEWDAALENLRVCNHKSSYQQGNYNCGQCEKCVRTKLALLSLGLLERTKTFKDKDIPKKVLRKAASQVGDDYDEACYTDVIPYLRQYGRGDLISSIWIGVSIYRLKSTLKRVDQRVFQGRLLKIMHRLRRFPETTSLGTTPESFAEDHRAVYRAAATE